MDREDGVLNLQQEYGIPKHNADESEERLEEREGQVVRGAGRWFTGELGGWRVAQGSYRRV